MKLFLSSILFLMLGFSATAMANPIVMNMDSSTLKTYSFTPGNTHHFGTVPTKISGDVAEFINLNKWGVGQELIILRCNDFGLQIISMTANKVFHNYNHTGQFSRNRRSCHATVSSMVQAASNSGTQLLFAISGKEARLWLN